MTLKRIAPLAISALLLGAVAANAEEPTTTNSVEEVEKASIFVQQTGKVTSVEDFNDGKLFFVEDGENIFHFYVDDNTLVYDNTGKEVNLEVGNTISLYVYGNQPMILIYPPRYTPSVVIVETEKPGFVKVDQFDENHLSADGQLQLNLNEDSVIVDAKGKKVSAEELKNYSAIVFYGPTTRSLPPQTSPEKTVVFPKLDNTVAEETPDAEPKIDEIIDGDFRLLEGQKMVPLRKVAEGLGYKVDATKKGAIISKNALTYTITRDEKTYGYNKALGQFKVAPTLLEEGKTYVEYDFALELLK
ncbi:stalk domain-containing protein [Solibacillus daqui]|uniref:stalk domain-containing protein n=1 Tax=Solibacillus daqui TaxID=2912187 RepID=UPI002365F673|nr:stalk domain-containing protein [Solibacillus daqui]